MLSEAKLSRMDEVNQVQDSLSPEASRVGYRAQVFSAASQSSLKTSFSINGR
jgi:hypothetical protein